MKGIAAIVLGINTLVFTPNYLHASAAKTDNDRYIAAHGRPAQNSNPAPQQMVAHSIYNLILEARIGNVSIPMGFYVQVHNSKPKNNDAAILHNASDLYQFLQNNEYEQIFLFKMLESGIHYEKPLVKIDKNEKTVHYSLEGEDNAINYYFGFERGFDQVQPKLIEGIVTHIIGWQEIIKLKRKGIIIPQFLEVIGIKS